MDAAGDVVVDGWGALAEEVAAQLRRCGVRVHAGALAADAADLLALDGGPLPGAVVLVSSGAPRPSAGVPWHARGVPVLPVLAVGEAVVVGPLSVAGAGPCPACVGVPHDRDPGVPEVPGDPRRTGPGHVLGAAVATVTTLAALRGDHSLAALSTEVGPHGAPVTHRLWHARPGCRCSPVRMVG